jgi:Fe-S cluster biogenesis protein NfuA
VELVEAKQGIPDHISVESLELAIDYLRTALHKDGGDIRLIRVDDQGVVHLELLGACGTCPMSIFTMVSGVELVLMSRVPGVTGVVADTL